MTFYVENEVMADFGFDLNEIATKVAKEVLAIEQCTLDVSVKILITDEITIRAYNHDYRNIDASTDVLSFPNVDYDTPSDFSIALKHKNDYFDPDSGELLLGDIIICKEKVISQAEDYEHSLLREFAFLIAHSMLHLMGYDHLTEVDETVMLAKQKQVLSNLSINREK